ncbi:MAG: aminopeptidase P family protein, partial [Rhodospirillaceae bacterium]|nr:aminopeptidase P family protein [Rhodospirillaceae bacterium]
TTGYYVYQILLLPLDGTPQFVTSRLEHECVRALSWIKTGLTVFMGDDEVVETLRGFDATGATIDRIGYEERGFWLPPRILDAVRDRWGIGATMPAGFILEDARRIKSTAELACIREAAHIASVGMRRGLEAVAPGRTENEVAGDIYQAMMAVGGEHPAGGPYVVTGPRAAVTHMLPERAVIEPGHAVYFEVGGCYKRYSGSNMRMAHVGQPGNEAGHRAAVSIEALEAMLETIKPGATSQDVDRAGRSVMTKGGIDVEFRHRAGYSMGVAFAPGWGEGLVNDIAEGNERPLEPGMTFHLVPMAGFRGEGNMGFSETVLVTEGGCEVLTAVPRELHICNTAS